jgi:hypothetical protein
MGRALLLRCIRLTDYVQFSLLDYEMWWRELINLGNLACGQKHSGHFLGFYSSQSGTSD